MLEISVDILGWAGALCLLWAYHANSTGKFPSRSIGYQSFNLIGSICLTVNSGYYDAFPSAVLNIIWAAVGINSLISITSHFGEKETQRDL